MAEELTHKHVLVKKGRSVNYCYKVVNSNYHNIIVIWISRPKETITNWAKICPIWDLCSDFRNSFAEKNCEKIGVFDSKQS
jgi:hypothetical protein